MSDRTRLRRMTCRPPQKDTLKLLRAEVGDLLRTHKATIDEKEKWYERYYNLRARYQRFTDALRAVTALDEVNPFPDEGDLDDEVPF